MSGAHADTCGHVMARPELPTMAMSGSMTLLPLGSLLMSVVYVITKAMWMAMVSSAAYSLADCRTILSRLHFTQDLGDLSLP